MCNTTKLKLKTLFIEVFENGKISLPAFVTPEDQTLSIEELKRCREYLDLIIANPDNFHVVKPVKKRSSEELARLLSPCKLYQSGQPENLSPGTPFCKVCKNALVFSTKTEQDNGLCFDCEKKQILNQVNRQVGNYVEQLKSTLTPEQQELVSGSPKHIVEVKISERLNEIEAAQPVDMKPVENGPPYNNCVGCDKVLAPRNKQDGFCNMCKSRAGK